MHIPSKKGCQYGCFGSHPSDHTGLCVSFEHNTRVPHNVPRDRPMENNCDGLCPLPSHSPVHMQTIHGNIPKADQVHLHMLKFNSYSYGTLIFCRVNICIELTHNKYRDPKRNYIVFTFYTFTSYMIAAINNVMLTSYPQIAQYQP